MTIILTSKEARELDTGGPRAGELGCDGPPPLVRGDHMLLGLGAGDHDQAIRCELTRGRVGGTRVSENIASRQKMSSSTFDKCD